MHSLYLLCRYTITGGTGTIGYDFQYSPCEAKSCGLSKVTQANVGVARGRVERKGGWREGRSDNCIAPTLLM